MRKVNNSSYRLGSFHFPTLILAVSFIFISDLAGGTSGKITGQITDRTTGDPLIGCNIIVEGEGLGAATDIEGYYFILNVPPGSYRVTSMMIGYARVTYTDVIVNVDLTTTLDFQLTSEVLAGEEVTVVAEKPIVTKDLTSARATISSETISQLPVETFADILELQAGIVKGSDNKIHIRGGRASEVVYLIDGISVNDPFSNEISVEVENEAIQELQVVSGTFNAEYGQVMSGVVDIVTKEGGRKYSGNVSAYLGDYFSLHSDIFPNVDDISPDGLKNIQASLEGPIPIFGKKLTFFSSGRFYQDQGWLYGQKYLTPGYLDQTNPDSVFWASEQSDSAFVSMNNSLKLSLQGKLTYKPFPKIKMSYGIFWNSYRYRVYDHIFRFNPDGDYKHFKDGITQILTFNHTLSSRTYYTIKLSGTTTEYSRYVFEDSEDLRYVDVESYKGRFYEGGTKQWHVNRKTISIGGKFDFISQVTHNHYIKSGIDIRKHTVRYKDFKVLMDYSTGYLPTISEDVPGNVNYNDYVRSPIEAAVYIQDKMEFDDMIVNAGIRMDYFEPDGVVPIDPRDPDNAKYFYIINSDLVVSRIPERDYNPETMTIIDTVDIQDNPWVYKYRQAKPIYTVSPRIGVAYPISTNSVLHFSYGHFTQIPPFQYLYYNSEFEVRPGPLNKDEGKGVFDRIYTADPEAEGNKMGNAALKPQRTVIYELGLQQQISDNIGIDVTAFYKDMRHLLGTEIVEMYDTRRYARYINRDIGNTRGITFALHRRQTDHISMSVDYTYQIAKGTASDPNDAFLDAIGGRESEIRVVSLDWDQAHTLNLNLIVSYPGFWGFSILGKLGSGLPYTFEPPQFGTQFMRFENNERKPSQITVDMNFHRDLSLGPVKGTIFFKAYNLFDNKNEIAVYNDTGRSGYTIRTQYWGEWQYISSIEDWVNRPHMFSQPRRVILGFSLSF